ncbi:MAG: hypothetical protein ACQGVK_15675 [Myxococcota bacterium]
MPTAALRACLLLVAASSVLQTGCMFLAKEQPSPVEILAPPHRPFVEYQISPDFQVTTPGGGYIKLATSTKIGRSFMDGMLDRWEDQGAIEGYAYVNPTRGDFTERSNLRLVLEGAVVLESNFGLQLISGLTLLVIPAYGSRQYDLLRADLGGRTYRAYSHGRLDEWVQILLIPATPFAPFVESRFRDRLRDDLYEQLRRAGIFDRAEPSDSGG